MRLVCPNCEAKYEVPDDAIPDTGRDVQCTNCGHSWYQMRARTGALPLVAMSSGGTVAEAAPDTPEPEADTVAEARPAEAGSTAKVEATAEDATAVIADATVTYVSGSETMPSADTAPEPALAEIIADEGPAEATATALSEGEVVQDEAAAEAAERVIDGAATVDVNPAPEPEAAIAAEAEPASDAVPVAETAPEPEPEPDVSASAEQIIADIVATEALPDAAPETVAEAVVEAAAEARDDDTPAPAPDYAVDDSVLAILREEAEREANARRAEALESQTDLGIDAAMPRKTAAMAAEAESKPSARRDLLPDVEEINSTLRPSEMQAAADGTPDFVAPPPEAPRGFRSGFLTLMTVAILAAALYLVAPRLALLVPSLAGPLESYMSLIDSLRLGLDGMMRSATVAISDG